MDPLKPTIETLAALASGELPASEAAAVERALSGDAERSATLARLQGIVETLRSDDSVAPPDVAVRRVQQVLRKLIQQSAVPAPHRAGATVRWWELACRATESAMRLIFDSRGPEVAPGFRSSTSFAESRLLAFERDSVEIELQVESRAFDADSQRCQLIGQLSARRVAGLPVVAVGADGEVAGSTETDGSGVFVLSLPAGTYDLVVGGDEASGVPTSLLRSLEVP